MSILVGNLIMPGRFNNYVIAGNVCNAFALGELGAKDDFFLVGAEPEEESSYPLLTGTVLDSEGNVLFQLVRNVLTLNPGGCARILSDEIGYEIHDRVGNLVLRVRTTFEALPGTPEKMFLTTIAGRFFNKNRQLVFEAKAGQEGERILNNVKSVFGCSDSGGLGLVQDMSDEDADFARILLQTRCRIRQLLRGKITGQELTLDGKAVLNAEITNCTIHVHSGDFLLVSGSMHHNEMRFHDDALKIIQLWEPLEKR